MNGEEENTAILDIGSFETRGGYVGEDEIKFWFPTVVGRSKNQARWKSLSPDSPEYRVGDESYLRSRYDTLMRRTYFVNGGKFKNDAMLGDYLHHSFYSEFRRNPEDIRLILPSKLDDVGQNLEILELLFERFQVKGVSFVNSAISSLVASGNVTGCNCDIGYDNTTIFSVFEGSIVDSSRVVVENVGGRHIKEEFLRSMYDQQNSLGYGKLRNYEYSTKIQESSLSCKPSHFVHFDQLKNKNLYEKYSYEIARYLPLFGPLLHLFPIEIANEIFTFTHNEYVPKVESYTLIDGSEIHFNDANLKCCEVLFQPRRTYIDGLPYSIYRSITNCKNFELRKLLKKNILVTGGSSSIENLEDRMTYELREQFGGIGSKLTNKEHLKVTCLGTSCPGRVVSIHGKNHERPINDVVFVGTSVLYSMDSFRKKFVERDGFADFKEEGKERMRKKLNIWSSMF